MSEQERDELLREIGTRYANDAGMGLMQALREAYEAGRKAAYEVGRKEGLKIAIRPFLEEQEK